MGGDLNRQIIAYNGIKVVKIMADDSLVDFTNKGWISCQEEDTHFFKLKIMNFKSAEWST
jgi:hypothetical protein